MPLREPLLSLVPTVLSGLWTTPVPCSHCSVSIQGWAADRYLFFSPKENLGGIWMIAGAVLGLGCRCWPLGLQISVIHPWTEHARSLGPSRHVSLPTKCLSRPRLDFPPSLCRVLILSGPRAQPSQRAMQMGSGVGCYSLTDCALLAPFEILSSPVGTVHQPRRNGPHEPSTAHLPHLSSAASPSPQNRGGAAGTAAGSEARGSRSMPSSADGRPRTDEMGEMEASPPFPATHNTRGFATALPRLQRWEVERGGGWGR